MLQRHAWIEHYLCINRHKIQRERDGIINYWTNCMSYKERKLKAMKWVQKVYSKYFKHLLCEWSQVAGSYNTYFPWLLHLLPVFCFFSLCIKIQPCRFSCTILSWDIQFEYPIWLLFNTELYAKSYSSYQMAFRKRRNLTEVPPRIAFFLWWALLINSCPVPDLTGDVWLYTHCRIKKYILWSIDSSGWKERICMVLVSKQVYRERTHRCDCNMHQVSEPLVSVFTFHFDSECPCCLISPWDVEMSWIGIIWRQNWIILLCWLIEDWR